MGFADEKNASWGLVKLSAAPVLCPVTLHPEISTLATAIAAYVSRECPVRARAPRATLISVGVGEANMIENRHDQGRWSVADFK